ncbi:MAG: DegT/DnrJ/EryC1/StrS family aminotransferase, partial [Cyclobacteriaceae bacterium]
MKTIPVTKPFSPPIEEYKKYLDEIWERNWYTNNGPLLIQLQENLREYLGVREVACVSNGTVALQIALKALGIKGKVITTPFSYVATTSSIFWEGCTPVFADIDPHSLNIDPLKILEVIDKDTEAILATHCFGNACEIDFIEKIASEHGLKVIYDAAHCFGTKYKGESIFNFGDISTTSFHATKLFHSIEGGAIFSQDKNLRKRISFLRNFGHDGPEKFSGVGINGKNSEFHAAMGLCNLRYIDEILERRKHQSELYLSGLSFEKSRTVQIQKNTTFNFAYFPLIFDSFELMNIVKSELEKDSIFPRRYFFPSLSSLDYLEIKQPTPISDEIASKVICLPLY